MRFHNFVKQKLLNFFANTSKTTIAALVAFALVAGGVAASVLADSGGDANRPADNTGNKDCDVVWAVHDLNDGGFGSASDAQSVYNALASKGISYDNSFGGLDNCAGVCLPESEKRTMSVA